MQKIEEQQNRDSFYRKKDRFALSSAFEWADPKFVDCILVDSTFARLSDSIVNMVHSKSPSVPTWMIKAAVAVIDNEITNKTGVAIKDISPLNYSYSIDRPAMLVLGGSFFGVGSYLFD